MVRSKGRVSGILLVLASLLGILIGLPVNVVSDYLPDAVVSHKAAWITCLVLLSLVLGSLTWAVPRLQERRRPRVLFSVPSTELWIDRPELATTIKVLIDRRRRFSSLAASLREKRDRAFPPLGPRVAINSWADPRPRKGAAKDVCVVGIVGHGGAGKTSLAAAVCSRPEVRRYFAGGLIWITLGRDKGAQSLVERINGAVAVLTGEHPAASDPEQASQHLKRALAAQKRTMLVIDDVWNDRELELFVPNESTYCLLFTTRMRALLPSFATPVRLDHLPDDTASSILGSDLPKLPPSAEAELLDATGRLPLLLSLVNRRLREELGRGSNISVAADQAIGHLRERGPAAFDVQSRSKREKLVADTIEYSLETLASDDRQRFLELSIFPEDTDIPVGVVELLWARTGGLAVTDVARLCERLEELSLLTRKWSDGLLSLKLHSIIRRYARIVLTERKSVQCSALLLKAIHVPSAPPLNGRLWWKLPIGADYFLDNLAYHLVEARLTRSLELLIGDLTWLSHKIARFGVFAAEKDLAEVRTPLSEKLGSALLQNAHLFDPADSVDTVAGTLLTRVQDIPEFLERVSESIWYLKPQWPFSDAAVDPLMIKREHRSSVAGIAVAPGGTWFVSAGLDGVLNKYDGDGHEQWTLMQQKAGMTSVAIAPAGDRIVAGDANGSIHVMSADGSGRVSLHAHRERVNSVAIAHDGSWFVSGSSDGSIMLWDIGGVERGRLYARSGEVQVVAIPGKGPHLVSADSDGAVRLWDENGGIRRVLFGRARHVSGLAVSPDGSWLAAAGDAGIVQLWGTDGEERTVLRGHRGMVRSLAIAPDGSWLASGGLDGSLRLWTADATNTRVIDHRCGGVSTVAIEPRGTWVVTGGLDGSIRAWASKTIWQAGSASRGVDIRSVAVSPDGGWLASACSDGSVRLWDSNGAPGEILNQHDRWVSQVAIAQDGSWFASAGWDGKVCIWSPDGSLGGTLSGHPGGATAVAIAPDGSWLAAGARDGSLYIWDMALRELRHVLPGSPLWVSSIAIAPDGAWWATAAEDGKLLLWNADGTPRGVLHGHRSAVRSVVIAPDGQWLASADMSGGVRLWDAKGDLRCVLDRDDLSVASIAVSFDGSKLAVTYSDGLIRLWDVQQIVCLTAARLPGPLRSCTWFPEVNSLCVSGAKGLYRLAAMSPAQPPKQ
ncbi:NB-ARC domain-containing protein [Nonomuraea sp. NPDC050643]|uniref:WD40 domain-containing protein n=1 Tax=Nonomuraea sp. NPDC050643 TaxID=3155660 RepID=UPI0033F3933C